MKLYNSTQKNLISDDVKVAQNFFTRTVGLLSKKFLPEGEALIIKPSCSVHTFFMRFEIDVLFTDRKGKIIALYENVKPFRILPIHLGSNCVVELASGTISAKSIKKGDLINIEELK